MSYTTPPAILMPPRRAQRFTLGSNFSSPDPWSDGGLKGLSYSFDVNNARFILLDQFAPTTGNAGYNASTTIAAQQSWISQQLSSKPAGSHAFVFSHKGLITCNHTDVLFGNDPSQNPTAQNAFFSSLLSNKVGYYINGHDHIHDRSLIASPDGNSSVMQILCASDSSKFYVPQGSGNNFSATIPLGKSNDTVYNTTPRRQVISQELYTVGYYVFTVNRLDGNRGLLFGRCVPIPVKRKRAADLQRCRPQLR